MNWIEKLQSTAEAVRYFDRLKIVFDGRLIAADGAFIENVRKRIGNVASEYLEFLKVTDGATFASCVICGSDTSVYPLAKAEMMSCSAMPIGSIPIGMNGSGDPFILLSTREVALGNRLPYRSDLDVLAPNFGKFLEDVMMGPLFPKAFSTTWEQIVENEWTAYLRLRGWNYFHK